MKIFKSILSAFLKVVLAIYKAFVTLFVSLFTGIKYIAIKTGEGIAFISHTIWRYLLRYIVISFKQTGIFLWKGIKFIYFLITTVIIWISIKIYKIIIKPIFIALRFICIWVFRILYNYILLSIYKALKFIITWLYKILYVYFIKQIAIFIYEMFKWFILKSWNYIIKPFIHQLKIIASWIYNKLIINLARFIRFIFKWIYKIIFIYIIKNILLTIKQIAIFLYEMFKWFILKSWNKIIKPFIHALKIMASWIYNKLIINLVRFIRFIFKWIYKIIFIYIIKNILLTIKEIAIWIYQKIMIPISKFIRFIFRWIHKIIFIYIIKNIYKGIKWLLENLWDKVIKQFFISIGKIIRWIAKTFWNCIVLNIFKLFKYIFKNLYNLIKYISQKIIYFLKYGYRSLPDIIYLSIKTCVIYFILFIHFLFVMIPKFILYTLPVNIIKYIYRGLRFIFRHIYKTLSFVFKKLFKILRKILKPIKVFFRLITDFIIENAKYFYVILFSPIVLPIFIVIMAFAFIKSIIVLLILFFKTLFNVSYVIENEVIYIKELYIPFANIFKYGNKYVVSIKNNLTKTIKFKNVWYLINLITWNLFFSYIISFIFALLLLPFTLLSMFYYFLKFRFSYDLDKFLKDRVIRTSKLTNGIIYCNRVKFNKYYYDFDFNVHANYDENIDSYIINSGKTDLNIVVLVNGLQITNFDYAIKYSELHKVLNEYCRINNYLLERVDPKFSLPLSISEDIKVSYSTVRAFDVISENEFIQSDNILKSKIRVKLNYLKYEIEREVVLANIINTKFLDRICEKGIFIVGFENIKNYINVDYDYTIIESKYVDSYGNILDFNNGKIEVSLFINKIPEKIYTFEVHLYLNKRNIKKCFQKVNTPIIDIEKDIFILDSQLKINDRVSLDLNWCFDDNEIILDDKVSKYICYNSNLKYYKFSAYCWINGIKHQRKFKVVNPTRGIKNAMLYAFSIIENSLTYLKSIDKIIYRSEELNQQLINKKSKNVKYVFLPFIGVKYIKFIKFKSLNKMVINSAGKLTKSQENTCLYKVTLYHNLFTKVKINVELRKDLL